MKIGRGTLLRDKHGYTYRVRELLVDTSICLRTSPGGHDSVVMLGETNDRHLHYSRHADPVRRCPSLRHLQHLEETPVSYPHWICATCGDKYGNGPCGIACWHMDTCGLCGDFTSCTEPRDYKHLREAPMIFKCSPSKGAPFTFTPRHINAQALRALEFLEEHLTSRGKGPILTVTVRGLTFHRTPEGAYQRKYDRT